jgi:fengycin family lipopeptide synthetase B
MGALTTILENKNVLITGASGGLERCIAKQFALEGCNLYLTGRNEAALQAIAEEIGFDKKIFYKTANLENIEDLVDLALDAKNKFENIDILINCAGVFIVKSLSETYAEDFENTFNLNVRAPFLLCQEFLEGMLKNKWGRIINIGSSSSYAGFKNTSAYCASKHALLGLTRALHDEYRDQNIRSFCFSPGSIQTEMGKKVKNQDFDTFIDPVEIAKYIIFSISFDGEMISNEIQLKRINI